MNYCSLYKLIFTDKKQNLAGFIFLRILVEKNNEKNFNKINEIKEDKVTTIFEFHPHNQPDYKTHARELPYCNVSIASIWCFSSQ